MKPTHAMPRNTRPTPRGISQSAAICSRCSSAAMSVHKLLVPQNTQLPIRYAKCTGSGERQVLR